MDIEQLLLLTKEAEPKQSKSDGELLQVFKETGEFVGNAPRLICHRLGLIHKVVYCFIVNSKGELLLQTRGEGRLDITIGGHLNSDDSSVIDALIRESYEEIGISLDKTKLVNVCQYLRDGAGKLAKPRESNREIRELFVYELSVSESESISEIFKSRLEKEEVLNIEWYTLDDVAKACDLGNAADGLQASFYHYLIWAND